jgi:leader peptidase (prepilin peptidase)/N-methyltransferase
MSDGIAWPLVLGVLGTVFGSHVATVAVRWPQPASGRSRCDGCGRELGAAELVPLLSWTVQRRRCRTCKGAINPLHPSIELLGALIGVSAGVAASGWTAVAGAAFGWLLLALGSIDFVAFRLPNALTAALAVAGLATGVLLPPPLPDRVIGGALGFGVLWLAAILYDRIRGRVGLGIGDAKLFGAIGLWLGWRALPAVLLVACVAGLVWALAKRMRHDDRLPLGTLLAGAAFAMWLWSVLAECGTPSPCLTLVHN